jgi:hypothetical protein
VGVGLRGLRDGGEGGGELRAAEGVSGGKSTGGEKSYSGVLGERDFGK